MKPVSGQSHQMFMGTMVLGCMGFWAAWGFSLQYLKWPVQKIVAPPYRHKGKKEGKNERSYLVPWWRVVRVRVSCWASPSAQPLAGLLSPRDDAQPPWPQVSAARPLWRPLWTTSRHAPPPPACAPGRRFVLRSGETEPQSSICLLDRGRAISFPFLPYALKKKKN